MMRTEVAFYRVRRNRRKFFDTVASKLGFDPLIASNWYKLSKNSIEAFKDGVTVLGFYKNNLSRALNRIYPNLQLERNKFQVRDVYKDPKKRFEFFESFAKENEFDPRLTQNWYSRTRKDIIAFKDGRLVLRHYQSLPTALMNIYPQLDWDTNKFKVSGTDWRLPAMRRAFFEKIAKEFEIDPLIPTDWFAVSVNMIIPFKGATQVLQFYNNKLSSALSDLFPTVRSYNDFGVKYQLFQNFRPRLEQFAKEIDFDHLNAQNWYSVMTQDILDHVQGGKKLLEYFSGDLARALAFVFPNLLFDASQFYENHQAHVTSPRKLFDDFADKNSFNPLLAENWYKITRNQILSMKGSEAILEKYGSSLPQAVAQIYPEIGVDVTKFKFMQKQYWKDVNNQRVFFMELAKEKGFDPLHAENWYSCSYWDIITQKKASSVLAYYHGSHKKALINVFPNLGLEESKFVHHD